MKAILQKILNEHDYKALCNSLNGFMAAYQDEVSFRIEVIWAIVLIPLGCFLGHSRVEKVLLLGTVFLVLIVELLNTAIENLTDLASPEIHPLAKKAKDMGSAAVFVVLINFIVTWCLIIF